MKPLESDKLEQLLEVIEAKPGQRIVQFADRDHTVSQGISETCKHYDNHYYLNCTEDTFYEESLVKFSDQPHIHISKFILRRPRYKMQGIEYDYLFATLDFEKEDKVEFLQKCYPIIRTGGNIIIIIPNSDYPQQDEWREILEEQYYVSSNIIDDLFEHYDVIIAKRMHGWGN